VDLAAAVYTETAVFPAEERFGLTAQIRRAAISVVANIAEGNARWGPKQFAHFLDVANGSLREVQALVHTSFRLRLISEPAFERLLEPSARTSAELTRLLQRLRAKLR
jgi:four helix bundle protein